MRAFCHTTFGLRPRRRDSSSRTGWWCAWILAALLVSGVHTVRAEDPPSSPVAEVPAVAEAEPTVFVEQEPTPVPTEVPAEPTAIPVVPTEEVAAPSEAPVDSEQAPDQE